MDRYNNQEKTYYKVDCADCGEETEVPFKPIGKNKLRCKACHIKNRDSKK